MELPYTKELEDAENKFINTLSTEQLEMYTRIIKMQNKNTEARFKCLSSVLDRIENKLGIERG